MSVSTAPRNQLEESLARLSQQMETVEGKFNRILGPDANYPRTSARTSHVESQVYRSPNRNSNVAEPLPASASYATRNFSYSYQPNSTEQPRSSQPSYQVEKSNTYYTTDITPVSNYRYSETVKRSAAPPSNLHHHDFSTPRTITTYEIKSSTASPSRPPKTEEEEEELPSHDFNDKELLALILNENSTLKTGSPSVKTIVHSHEPLKYETIKRSYTSENHHTPSSPVMTNAKVEEILRNIAVERASQGDKKLYSKPEGLKIQSNISYSPSKDYSETVKRSSRPPRQDEIVTPVPQTATSTTITSPTLLKLNEYIISKSSLPLDVSTYQTSSTPKPVETRKIEEWQYRKYLNKTPVEEDDDDGSNFCGVCVSKRSVKK